MCAVVVESRATPRQDMINQIFKDQGMTLRGELKKEKNAYYIDFAKLLNPLLWLFVPQPGPG